MEQVEVAGAGIIAGDQDGSLESVVLNKDRWEEIRRLHEQQCPISEIARQLDVDRKTVRKALREPWRPYVRISAIVTGHFGIVTGASGIVTGEAHWGGLRGLQYRFSVH